MTSEDHIVHVTRPFEFLDSPEWVSSKLDQATNYDVCKYKCIISVCMAIHSYILL